MALLVETGEGILDAESYVSVEEADAYFALYGNEDWAAAEEPAKEIALRTASRDIDLLWGATFTGTIFTTTQGLYFPRTVEGVPLNLKRATAEMALMILGGYSATAVASDTGAIIEESKEGLGFKKSVKYAFARNSHPELERIRLMLGGLVFVTGSNVFQMPLVRG